MSAVVAGPNGFVAVGTTDDGDAVPVGLAWTSVDGRTWTRSSGDLREGDPSGIIWDGTRYIAFGGGLSVVSPQVWTSPDGFSWQRASGIEEVTQLAVAKLGNQLVAVGAPFGDSDVPRTLPISAWTSSDGLTWESVAGTMPSLNSFGGMSAADGQLVVWGSLYGDDGSRAVTLRSTDGATWEQSVVGNRDDRIWDVASGDGLFAAVGSGPYCCEAGATAPVKAWTSSDARTWTEAAFQPQPGNDRLEHVIRHARRYVAIGTNAGTPIEWLSNDGVTWTEGASVPDAAADGDPCTGGPCPLTTVQGLAGGSPGLVAVGLQNVANDDGMVVGLRSVVWIAPAQADGRQ